MHATILYIANNRVSKRKAEKKKSRQKLVHEFNIHKLLQTYTRTQEDKKHNASVKSNVIVNCNGMLDTFKWIGCVEWGGIAKHHDCS